MNNNLCVFVHIMVNNLFLMNKMTKNYNFRYAETSEKPAPPIAEELE